MSSRAKNRTKLPREVRDTVGKGQINKGSWKGNDFLSQEHEKQDSLYLVAWDFVEKCAGENCPLYNICEYKDWWLMNRNRNPSDKCLMQSYYMKNVISAFLGSMKKSKMDEQAVLQMGYHLLPLYSQLFKFKCWEFANHELVYVSEKGTPKVHPVYKEIREIIKTINGVWKDLSQYKGNTKDPSDIGDESFIDALHNVSENSVSENEEKGAGIDFDEDGSSDTSSSTAEGAGIDFEEAGVKDESPRKRTTSRPYKQKPKRRRKPKSHPNKSKSEKKVTPYGQSSRGKK